jgi:hypothetical protein
MSDSNSTDPRPADGEDSAGPTPTGEPPDEAGAAQHTVSRAGFVTFDCTFIDLPPGTPAAPRPAGRERRIPMDDEPTGPGESP